MSESASMVLTLIDELPVKEIEHNIQPKKKTKAVAPTFTSEEDKALYEQFNTFRRAYKGVKRGLETEFNNFWGKNKDKWREIIPMLMPAIQAEAAHRAKVAAKRKDGWEPDWKNLETWLNKKCWTIEYEPDVINPQFISNDKAKAIEQEKERFRKLQNEMNGE